MQLFRRRPGQPEPPRDAFEADGEDADEDRIVCCMCGRELSFDDPDDTLDTEGPGRHLCGSCYRSREQDALEAFENGF